MDAKGWLIEYQRMCRKYRDGESGKCVGCPLEHEYCGFDEELDEERISDMVSAVEKWSKENPLVTNGKKILELIGGEASQWESGGTSNGMVQIRVSKKWWVAEYKE